MEHPFFINGPPTNRSEALRRLSIIEKLLPNRDLVGSKSFATRACEFDPSLAHPIDQILSIVDILTAGDKAHPISIIVRIYFESFSQQKMNKVISLL
ncbi:hypothetical protein H5410_035243 [Solanum commersonii]|uniref:Uncharacterized protein n=1 Tax=Solanum commersonii TaxID=4109 RepID=A0A9J5Y044_SOLCO|nr:hypothetical protein H5410_035243 [Solanum commersonii]